jgi:ribose-phosphate pyrophosphokinase
MIMVRSLCLFGLNGSKGFAKSVAHWLDIGVGDHVERRFSDGEFYVKSLENVRQKHVCVISSLASDQHMSAGDKLITLALFVGSLKDASADRITVVCPYLAFSRQDRKTESRAPISTKYVAQMLESVGVDRFITLDAHSLSAFQNSFRIPTDNLSSVFLFADIITGLDRDGRNIIQRELVTSVGTNAINTPLKSYGKDLCFLAPDHGSAERTRRLCRAVSERLGLNLNIAVFNKWRDKDGEVCGSDIIGEVAGKKVIMFDDMICSGSTLAHAQNAVDEAGGEVAAVCATFGLFVGSANENMAGMPKIVVTDAVDPYRLEVLPGKLEIISTTRLIARTIKRAHEGGSVSELFD